MILAKCFLKQRNNLLLSMLPQRVPDLDKKIPPLPPFFFFFFSFGLMMVHRPFAFEPPYEETCDVFWTKVKKQKMVLSLNSIKDLSFTGAHVDRLASENITIQGLKK